MKKSDIIQKLQELNENGAEFVLITVVETKGSSPSETGGKMVLTSGGETFGTIGGGTLEKLVLNEAEQLFISGKSVLKNYILDENGKNKDGERTGMLCGGEVTVFLELIRAEDQVFLFGAGHIGSQIIHNLKGLRFSLTVFENREEILKKTENVKKFNYKDPEEIFKSIGSMDNGYIIIATHSHELDYKLLKGIVSRGVSPKYLGIVASVNKIDSMISRLKKELKGQFRTDFLFSPAGLDIGGRSPSEIGLAIVAEIQSVKYRKEGLKQLSINFRN